MRQAHGKQNNLSHLILDTPEAYYWAGFLVADGTFTAKRLRLRLAKKDHDHLKIFAKFCCIESDIDSGASAMCSTIIPQLLVKFGILPRKTYNPPDVAVFHKMSDSLFISFLAGICDGDGGFPTPAGHRLCNLRVKLHPSWLETLRYFERRVLSITSVKLLKTTSGVKLESEGYAQWTVSNHEIISILKQRLSVLNLPLMPRKWSKVETGYAIARSLQRDLQGKIIELHQQGKSAQEISQVLNIKYMRVYMFLKRKELEPANKMHQEKKLILDYYNSGIKPVEIATKTGITYGRIYMTIKRRPIEC